MGKQAAGDPFTYSLVLPGKYSTTGVRTGDHNLISINSAWTINDDFVFNGKDMIFSASISNYNPATDRIGLEYQIYGSPVPLPAAGWLMLLGLGGLGAFARKSAPRRLDSFGGR